jgi:hypothetical protein
MSDIHSEAGQEQPAPDLEVRVDDALVAFVLC